MRQGRQTTQILVVDDHPAISESINILTRHEGTMRVVGTAIDAAEAVAEAKRLKPDVILMDVRLPGPSGMDAAKAIRRFDTRVKIIFYTGFPEAASDALAIGAQGFVLKGNSMAFLMAAIKAVARGGICIDAELWPQLDFLLKEQPNPRRRLCLTSEEERIAELLVDGKISKEIAGSLSMSVRRVEKIRARLLRKFSVRNAVELAVHLLAFKA